MKHQRNIRLVEDDIRREKLSEVNRVNGSSLKKKPDINRMVLEEFREKFIADNGFARGWKKAAMLEYKISVNTINARLKNE